MMKFLTKMAGKSSLYNIKCAIEDLSRSFPHSPGKSSKQVFNLMEQVMWAHENEVSHEIIEERIARQCAPYDSGVRLISTQAAKAMLAAVEGREAEAAALELQLDEFFIERCGSPLDIRRIPLHARLANTRASKR